MTSAIIETVLKAAAGEVGVREATGQNDGKRVEAYLATVGLGAGEPWCAAFVQWAIDASAAARGVWTPENPAYCPSIYTWARMDGILHASPQRGDVFLYISDGWALHTGFVTNATDNGTRFSTVEGNTNPLGGAEGDGVYARNRPNNGAYVFVRWADLVPEVAPTVRDVTPATFKLIVKGVPVLDLPVYASRSYVRLNDFAKVFNMSLAWDTDLHKPRLAGKLVSCDVEIKEGRAWARINELLPSLGIAYIVDLLGRSVIVS